MENCIENIYKSFLRFVLPPCHRGAWVSFELDMQFEFSNLLVYKWESLHICVFVAATPNFIYLYYFKVAEFKYCIGICKFKKRRIQYDVLKLQLWQIWCIYSKHNSSKYLFLRLCLTQSRREKAFKRHSWIQFSGINVNMWSFSC